jgi:tetratricopeptide (TPR) repeat protein
MICPGCRTLNFRDYKFCRECGHKLDSPAPAQVTVSLAAPPAMADDDAQVYRLLDEAFRAMDAGNLSDAALACQGALALRPESTAAHSLLGLVYERQGELHDAIQQYRIVLDLNPSSQADRAKLNALLRKTGQSRPHWAARIRQARPRALVTGTAAVLVVLTGLLALARPSGPTAERQVRLEEPSARTAVAPHPALPPAPVIMPAPPAAQPAPPSAGVPGMGAVQRRTLSNGGSPRVTQVAVAPSRPMPRYRRSPSSPPPFLPPAPIRGITGLPRSVGAGSSPSPANGSVPVLPNAEADPAASPAVSSPAESASPAAPPPAATSPENSTPGASISIRPLDGPVPSGTGTGAPGITTGVQPTPPSLAEARQHFAAAVEMQRRGDYQGAYREFEYARELFRLVNNRGGTEGLLAADGARATHRAMMELAAARR